jgi:hypothetical protein
MNIVLSPFESNLSLVQEPLPQPKNKQKGARSNKWDPKPYEEEPVQQKALSCISIRDPFRCELLNDQKLQWGSKKVLKITNAQAKILKNPVELAEYYSDLIEHHVATRVSLFFLQAVVCYKTPFHYEIADTEGQFFTAKTLNAKAAQGPSIKAGYNAAHSSTIPGLKACHRQDYQKAKAKRQEPSYSPFLEGSHMENLTNSTVGLPTFVNQIDTLIDGKSKEENGLRGDTISLINQVATSVLSPCEATRSFLNKFLERLEEAPARSNRWTAEKKKIVAIYKKKVEEMIKIALPGKCADATRSFFDNLLTIDLSGEADRDIPLLREILYERKFEIIREAQFAEGKIQEAIATCFPQAKTPVEIHEIKLCLLLRVENEPRLKNALQKLFAMSLEGNMKEIEEDIKNDIKGGSKSDPALRLQIEKRYTKNSSAYDKTIKKISQIVHNFQCMEEISKGMLLRDFRKRLRGISLKKLSTLVQKTIEKEISQEKAKQTPDKKKIRKLQLMPASTKAMEQLEAEEGNILTLRDAEIISKALNIKHGHFFYSLFASREAA